MKNNTRLGVPEGDEFAPTPPSDDPNGNTPFANPDLLQQELKHGVRPGDLYVRKKQAHSRYFRRIGPGHFVATQELIRPDTALDKIYRGLKRILIGRPLETAEEAHQRLNKVKALAVFGSDAISSCAYATEETLLILMAAGNGALNISFYTALAVAVLLSVVYLSTRLLKF